MRKRGYFALAMLGFLGGIMSVPFWLSPKMVENTTNHFISPDYRLELPENWMPNLHGWALPYVKVKSEQCTLVDLEQVKLTGWFERRLSIKNIEINYGCIESLSQNTQSQTSTKLSTLLTFMPVSEVELSQIKLNNTASLNQTFLQDLLNAELSAKVYYQNKKLHLSATAKNDVMQLTHQSSLFPQNSDFQWQGDTQATLQENQHYRAHFYIQLNDEIFQAQPNGKINVHWENPAFAVAKGNADLTWEGENGHISAQDLGADKPLLDIPFLFTTDGLKINWGTFYWTFDDYQPLKGFIGLDLHTPKQGWLPLGIDLNVILQTFGEQGKGEIVISGKNGEIGGGENQDQLRFNLTTRGDLRYNNSVAKTNLTYHIGGSFNDPMVRFHPGSVFKMDNLQTDAKIHARFPLDNIQVTKYGLDGKLQATLQGFTPQFSDLDLNLTGEVDEFIAGIKTVFQIRDEKEKLNKVEKEADNRWDWTLKGKAFWKSLNTSLYVNGVGFWKDDHIELNQLTAYSENINTGGVKMAPLSLELKDRLRWDYENAHIRGLMQAKTDWVEFDYGGRFQKPILGLGIDGTGIDSFNITGDLKAGMLGPINLNARYENQDLTGKIKWKLQSAKIFQSLFPKQWGWIIHHGVISGESDFNINSDGVTMAGNLALKDASVSFPDGEIQGFNVIFPLNLKNNELSAKFSKPIRISMKTMYKGALNLKNASLEMVGTYPNSLSKPLMLKNVKIGIFDGELQVDNFSSPQQKIATLSFKNIDLKQIMEMAQYNQISLTGRIDATFPFWLNHKDCLICEGRIEQKDKLHIKLSKELIKGLKEGGVTENILVDFLNEMELDDLRVNVDLSPQGDMLLRSNIKAYNPNKKYSHPISLNYTHKENMFELWNMINYGSQFEQNLQYQLYKKLEK